MSLSVGGYGSMNVNTASLSPYEQQKIAENRERMGIKDPVKEALKTEDSKPVDKKKLPKTDPNYECQTCKNRKYQDGSDEMVSFKTAQHMSPGEAATRVRAHEQEHVSNAYTKAAQEGAKVLQASVAIHTAVCPECGKTYVSGGTTTTRIKYYNDKNPYDKARKVQDSTKTAGKNIDTGF